MLFQFSSFANPWRATFLRRWWCFFAEDDDVEAVGDDYDADVDEDDDGLDGDVYDVDVDKDVDDVDLRMAASWARECGKKSISWLQPQIKSKFSPHQRGSSQFG